MTQGLFHHQGKFELESGGYLPGFQLKYSTAGTLNKDRSNVVWVTHALTGSSDVLDWWKVLFDVGGVFDLRKNFVVCANALGGCYGSTGALSINPETGKTFYHSFPLLTHRDVVRSFDLLREHLGFPTIHTLIGGSLGGQQVLEWALLKPDVIGHIVPIACNAWHSPWGIAFNEAQRMAIAADSTWKEDSARAGVEGMKAARAIAMISYRTHTIYNSTQTEKSNEKADDFRASSYQRYQGDKLASRFNAFTYWTFSKAMDNHNIARGRASADVVLKQIRAKTLVVGIESDVLFPFPEQQWLAAKIPEAQLAVLKSDYGHDGFLVEFEQLNSILKEFINHSASGLQLLAVGPETAGSQQPLTTVRNK
jgi:homoserine O-acetyltransferase/O-succinyltransferase